MSRAQRVARENGDKKEKTEKIKKKDESSFFDIDVDMKNIFFLSGEKTGMTQNIR